MYGPSRKRVAAAVALGILGVGSLRFTPLKRPLLKSVELRHLSSAGCIASALLVLRAGRRDAFDDIFQFLVNDGNTDRAEALLRRLAEEGNPSAQNVLAWSIRNRLRVGLPSEMGRLPCKVPKSAAAVEELKEALNWYRKAADQGHAKARLAYYELLTVFGWCVKNLLKMKNPGMSKVGYPENQYGDDDQKRLQDAVAGSEVAQFAQGEVLAYRDVAAALEWFSKAADQGHLPAFGARCEVMVRRHARERKVPEAVLVYGGADPDRMRWAMEQVGVRAAREYHYYLRMDEQQLTRAANEEGTPEAQYCSGLRLSWGDDKAAASYLDYFKRAADQGHLDARQKYYENVGVDILVADARAGVPEAQWNLGRWGFGQTDTERAGWVLKAAQQGVIDAQERYADILTKGKWVEKNEDLARRWKMLSVVSRLREQV